jgi:hypothetical protein
MVKTKWEQESLLRIKREFSKEEKYKVLVDDYENMVKQVDKYKQELTKLKEKQQQLKKQLIEIQSKYTKLTKL